MKTVTSFLNNSWSSPEGPPLPVSDKFTGAQIAEFHETSPEQVADVIARAEAAFDGPPIPVADRVHILRQVATGIEARADELRDIICAESR